MIFSKFLLLKETKLNYDTTKMICYRSGLPEDGQFTITQLPKNPGMYSDPFGSLRTYRLTWKLVTYIDLSKFVERSDKINEEYSKLSLKCQNLKKACTVNSQITAMQKTFETLRIKWKTIKDLIQPQIESIDTIGSVIFGTLDEEVAKLCNSRIEMLEIFTQPTIELSGKQTKLMTSQFNEQRIKQINATQNFSYKFDNLSREINSLTSEIKINEKLIDLAKTLEQRIAENEKDTTILTAAISYAKKGKIHLELLSPDEIIQGAKAIQKAQRNVEFLLPLQTEYISQLLNLSDVTIYHTRGKLIYIISLIALDLEKYILYRNIPLPIYQHSNVMGAIFAYIKPHSPFTAISEDMKSYFQLDDNKFKDCKNISNQFICKRVKFFYQINDRSDCEVQIIVEPSFDNFAECDIRLSTSAGTLWLRVNLTNQWIFASGTPETILIQCENSIPRNAVINGTGILYLPPHCEVRISSSVILKSSVEFTNKMSTEFPPRAPLNLSAIYFAVVKSTDSLKLSEILSSSNSSIASNEDVKFQTVIKHAKKLSKRKKVNERTHFGPETIALYSGLGFASLLIILGIAWTFSLFSQASYLCSSRFCKKCNDKRHYDFENQRERERRTQ